MRTAMVLAAALAMLCSVGTSWAATRGVTEINEGTVRQVYVKKPLTAAKGYVVADWAKGQVRVEVMKFPASAKGYEAFLFEIDVPAYMSIMFVGGKKKNGLVANPPPFSEVGGLISQWKSIGDLKMDGKGNGRLVYRKGDDLYKTGLNMIMIFEKVTPGSHAGPEDFSKLMIECNGPLTGTKGSEGMEAALTIIPK